MATDTGCPSTPNVHETTRMDPLKKDDKPGWHARCCCTCQCLHSAHSRICKQPRVAAQPALPPHACTAAWHTQALPVQAASTCTTNAALRNHPAQNHSCKYITGTLCVHSRPPMAQHATASMHHKEAQPIAPLCSAIAPSVVPMRLGLHAWSTLSGVASRQLPLQQLLQPAAAFKGATSPLTKARTCPVGLAAKTHASTPNSNESSATAFLQHTQPSVHTLQRTSAGVTSTECGTQHQSVPHHAGLHQLVNNLHAYQVRYRRNCRSSIHTRPRRRNTGDSCKPRY
jgi:hypothetical protein